MATPLTVCTPAGRLALPLEAQTEANCTVIGADGGRPFTVSVAEILVVPYAEMLGWPTASARLTVAAPTLKGAEAATDFPLIVAVALR